jgi:hypothetical protein
LFRHNNVYLCVYNVSHLLTPWSRVLFEKLTGLQLVKKSLAFYGTRRFITPLINARQLSLFWASPIQSIPPHPTSWRSILLLSSPIYTWVSPVFSFCQVSMPKPYTRLPPPHPHYMPRHLIFLDFITRTILGEEYRSWSSHYEIYVQGGTRESSPGP